MSRQKIPLTEKFLKTNKAYLFSQIIQWRGHGFMPEKLRPRSEDPKRPRTKSKKNYGLFIDLVEKKINYVNVQANSETIKRLQQIAKLNKVSVNPDFSIVDIARYKNVSAKLKKLYNKIL